MIRIMNSHPEMRHHLIYGVTQFVLSIPDYKHTLTFLVLSKVRCWIM